MTRYVVHIGPHKTGTTYLQQSFTLLQSALAARGICYPDTWGSLHGHFGIGERLVQGEFDQLQREFDDLAEHTPCHTILLSSETLADWGDARVPLLRQLLRGHDVTIVFYFRRWSELIPSLWRETVKHGSLEGLPEFALKRLQNPPETDIVNFGIILDRFAKVFGAGNLRTVSYNAVLEDGQDLLTHFCASFLDWPDPPLPGLGAVNASLDMVDTEIIRALNALEWTRARDARRRLFQHYLDMKDTLPVRWIVEQAMQYTVNRVRIDDGAEGLGQLHDDIARRYRGTLVAPCPDGRLFMPRLTDIDYIRGEYLMHPGVMEVMRDIQAKLLAAA
ncbi:MAG TPA: hypothetical protein VGG99_25055 [Acetobacteraceae bacterium]